MSVTYTRADLIEICERAIVPHDRWLDRDTPGAQDELFYLPTPKRIDAHEGRDWY